MKISLIHFVNTEVRFGLTLIFYRNYCLILGRTLTLWTNLVYHDNLYSYSTHRSLCAYQTLISKRCFTVKYTILLTVRKSYISTFIYLSVSFSETKRLFFAILWIKKNQLRSFITSSFQSTIVAMIGIQLENIALKLSVFLTHFG